MTSSFKKIFENAMNKVLNETDENFVSIVNNTNDQDIVKNNVQVDSLPEDKQEEKSKLVSQAIEKIKDSLKVSDELQSVLNQIKKINDDTDCNEWKINKEDNTAVLKNKNAKIFKQNNNLCLSHDNKIELFKTVQELHDWLKKNNYPLPHDIKLHESILNEGFGDIISSDEIIIPHTNTNELFRMEYAFKDSPWGDILKHRWENQGTSRGKVLGYAFNLNELPKGSTPNVQEIELEDGKKVYINASEINTTTNKAVPVYSTPDFLTKKTPIYAYYRPDDESITKLGVDDHSYIDTNDFYNTHRSSYKMGRDETKEMMDKNGYKQIASQTKGVKDTNLGAYENPDRAKIIDKIGLDRIQKYIGSTSDDGKQCIDILGRTIGTIENKKVYDKDHPDVQIGYVDRDGNCFRENTLQEDQIENLWYLKYQNSDLDQNYLNSIWRNGDLLTQSLDSAAKFSSREDAISELQDLFNYKTTQFPFKPVNINDMQECGCCGVTTSSLSSAVQYVSNPKKKEESLNEDEDLDEAKKDVYTKGRQDIINKYVIGAPVYNYKDEIIGYVTNRTTARNDASLGEFDNVSTIVNDANEVIGKASKEYPLARTNEGNTLGYANQGTVYGKNNHIIGKYDENNIVYDSKHNKLGIVSSEPIQIAVNTNNYPIGYVEDGEVFSFEDEKIGDVQDISDFEKSSSNERNYIVQDLDGNDIGYTTLQYYVRDFNGNRIGRVKVSEEAIKKGGDYDTLHNYDTDKSTQNGQSDFTTFAIGKKTFNPFNSKGEIKPLYANAINPGNYATSNLFGGLFDLNSKEINALVVDKETFINRINALNKMHGVNFDPEQPIYPRSASKGTPNQQAWDQLQQNYLNNVELKKNKNIADTTKSNWNRKVNSYKKAPENAEAILNTAQEVLNKANTDFDNAQGYPYRDILNYLKSVKEDKGIPESLKNTIYNMFTKSNIDGVADTVNLMFLNNQNESVLKEDDPTPADFADGGSEDVSLQDIAGNNDSSDTDLNTDDITNDLDDYSPEDSSDMPSFGDININNGSGMDAGDEENIASVPENNQKIIDVLANEKDMSQIKVKVKDLDTGKIEIKDLNEIDV